MWKQRALVRDGKILATLTVDHKAYACLRRKRCNMLITLKTLVAQVNVEEAKSSNKKEAFHSCETHHKADFRAEVAHCFVRPLVACWMDGFNDAYSLKGKVHELCLRASKLTISPCSCYPSPPHPIASCKPQTHPKAAGRENKPLYRYFIVKLF